MQEAQVQSLGWKDPLNTFIMGIHIRLSAPKEFPLLSCSPCKHQYRITIFLEFSRNLRAKKKKKASHLLIKILEDFLPYPIE